MTDEHLRMLKHNLDTELYQLRVGKKDFSALVGMIDRLLRQYVYACDKRDQLEAENKVFEDLLLRFKNDSDQYTYGQEVGEKNGTANERERCDKLTHRMISKVWGQSPNIATALYNLSAQIKNGMEPEEKS